MLFPYTYVPHSMDKVQGFIDFIFYEVWCKAPANGRFGLELFDSNPELRGVMKSFYYSDKKNAEFFYGSVEKIYGHFSALSVKQIRRLKWWYASNNNIERLCRNDSGVYIAHYSDLKRKFPSLAPDVRKFFTGLYDFDAAVLREKVGAIDEHYEAFMGVNTNGKCPFCGLADIKGAHHTKREAYDHYFPKTLYPFNSINFLNLAPACHECNSTYKLSKDPATSEAGRRKAFFPYGSDARVTEITIDLAIADLDKLTPDDIKLTFGPTKVCEEIATWKEIYGIDERYKAKCCDVDAKDWLEQIRSLRDLSCLHPDKLLSIVHQQTVSSPLANSNFLKFAFLEACQRNGLFDEF